MRRRNGRRKKRLYVRLRNVKNKKKKQNTRCTGRYRYGEGRGRRKTEVMRFIIPGAPTRRRRRRQRPVPATPNFYHGLPSRRPLSNNYNRTTGPRQTCTGTYAYAVFTVFHGRTRIVSRENGRFSSKKCPVFHHPRSDVVPRTG